MSKKNLGKADYTSIIAAEPLQIDDCFPSNGKKADDNYSILTSESGLTSLCSSIIDYRYENGRRYHAFHEGAYIGPNDEPEQERMDLVHHIYTLLLGGRLHLAPLSKNLERVLDIGTGTGLWAIDFADEHPSAHVTGNDLSPIQPKWVPPNCQFEIDDFESDWLYKTPFDYIHGRELTGCIGNVDKLFAEAINNLQPGGYIELQSVSAHFLSDDGTAEEAITAQKWMENVREAGRKFGKPLDGVNQWKQKLGDAGFVEVTEKILKVPIGTWPRDDKLKEVGKFQFVGELQAIEAYTPALFTRVLGWSELEMQAMIEKVKNEISDRSLNLYLPCHVVYGRKP